MIPRRQVHTDSQELAGMRSRIRSAQAGDEAALTRWELAIADHVGVPWSALVSSGRRGMMLVLDHLGVGPGDEVVIPAYTLKDLVFLIRDTGARPIPADIDPTTLNLDPQAVESRITDRTKAILALHAFGAPCAIEAIASLGKARGVPVIEDCAHSLGATMGGKQVGSFGHAAFFSFETTKPVNTFGGGAVVSHDRTLIERIRSETAGDRVEPRPVLGKMGAVTTEQRLFATGLAYPMLQLLASPLFSRLMTLVYRRFQHAPPRDIRYLPAQAELGLRKLASLEERIRVRKEKAALLGSLLSPRISVQRIEEGSASTWYFFVAILPCEAAPVRRRLLMHGVDAGVEGEIMDDCAALLNDGDCPHTNSIYPRAIALPLYEGLSEPSVRKIARVLNRIVS